MSIQICEEGRADIIKSIEEYIADRFLLAENVLIDDDDTDRLSIHSMYIEDAKYAQDALDQFKCDWDWYKLHDTLMAQDTEPRQEVFHYLRNVNEWLDYIED